MADEPWYMDPVRVDRETSDDAVHGLCYAAMGLSAALDVLEADLPVVVEDWRGAARMVFDEEMPTVLEAGHQLVAVLLAAGSSIAATYETADRERSLRTTLRDAYEQGPARMARARTGT